jgi:fructoselysine-6-P-deglycase FrlB-like protein
MTSASRIDVEAQAHALLEFCHAPVSLGLYPMVRDRHDRIILTGMGVSHFAALPSWRRLLSRGKETAWIDTRSLLDRPGLATPDSLLIATSRSGKRPELIALMEKFNETTRPATIVAITDNPASPLTEYSDCEILLRSRTCGSRGLLNILAAHDYIASLILNEDDDDVTSTARVVAATTFPTALGGVAAGVAASPNPRLVYIGFSEHATTSLYAALLTNETTGVVAQGYAGEQYPHDDLQQADADLTAILFGGPDPNAMSPGLAENLISAGATVIVVGDTDTTGSTHIRSPAGHLSARVAHGVVIADHFVSALATQMPTTPPR